MWMNFALKTWGVSRALSLGCAYASFRTLPHHDLSAELLEHTHVPFLMRWDALYFYVICKEGYVSDNSTAFFPLYPLLVRGLSRLLFLPVCICGVLLSNIAFCLSSVLLYAITHTLFGKKKAEQACVLFCFSPCSVLYSSMYTEALFCFFALLGVHAVLLNRKPLAALALAAASGVRSNGFILAPLLVINSALERSLRGCAYAVLPVLVFCSIQWHWWSTRFAHIGYMLPYSYVQAHYWEQGFLRFYTYKKNIPNVLVGAPFVLLSLLVLARVCLQARSALAPSKKPRPAWSSLLTLKNALVFVLFSVLLFQVLLTLFFIHMNMHFRFVSFNPLIYWELSSFFASRQTLPRLLLFGYFAFGVVYSVLFGAYFPPA
ncbi:GPI mannosyltransferase 2 [Nematocida sp. AWRm77]|nr:GPI mannosyltransferase 2 [Nematocida sp. AWRm77]